MRFVDGDHTLFMRIDSIAVKQARPCVCVAVTVSAKHQIVCAGNQETIQRICHCYSFFFSFPLLHIFSNLAVTRLATFTQSSLLLLHFPILSLWHYQLPIES
jgi:hypothetical protein